MSEQAAAAPAEPAAPATASQTLQQPATPAPSEPKPNAPAKVSDSGQVAQAPETKPTETKPASWMDGLSESMKEYVQSKHFQSAEDVVQSYMNFEKLKGVPQDRLVKLPEDSNPDAWNEVYNKLGKPMSPDGYGLKADGEDSSFADWAKNTFFESNLTTEQANKVVEAFNKYLSDKNVESKETRNKQTQKQEMDLKKEWGAAYHQNVARAQSAVKEFGVPAEAIDALEKAIGFDGTLKLMDRLGKRIGEATFVGGGQSQGFGQNILTPQQARARLDRLKSDPGFTSKYLAGDISARDEVTRLHQMANPDD